MSRETQIRTAMVMNSPNLNGTSEELTEGDFTRIKDPFSLFNLWMNDAIRSEINDPNAMALATTDTNGLPDIRVVLLKGFDSSGFVFYTNSQSAKGQELCFQPKAAAVFHWKSLERQVRIRGNVSKASDIEADAYFASRHRESQLGAWASQQSQMLDSREALEQALENQRVRFGDGPIPRPPHWCGYRITPLFIEFWQAGAFRLHDRVLFSNDNGLWNQTRLYP